MEEKLVLIDTDAGIDDAWALFLALAAHKNPDVPFRIVGITCVHGNTKLDNVTVNVTRVLSTAEEAGIPVFRGAESALVFPFPADEEPWHGEDGFGDAGIPHVEPKLEEEHAANAIVQLAEQYAGKLSLVALGPLTNLALAIRLQPNLNELVKDVYILGGTYQARGNASCMAEFNFLADAEAAHIVLESYAPCPITVFPWEACLATTTSFAFRYETVAGLGSPIVALMNAAEARIAEIDRRKNHWMAPDALIVAVFIEPEVIKTSLKHHCTIEVSGKHTRAMMVVDQSPFSQQHPNCTIVTDIHLPLYEKMILWAAGGPYYKA